MKNSLVIGLVLILAAVLSSQFREQPAQEGFSIHGIGLGWSDERVEALVGRELPNSDCPEQGAHFHNYGDGLGILFNETSFTAEAVYGRRLELDGRVVVQEGDRVEDIRQPSLAEIPLKSGTRLVARPVPDSYFDEKPEFGWKPILTKGADQVFRVIYRYESDHGTMTDAYDFGIDILALGGRVTKVQLRWMGH